VYIHLNSGSIKCRGIKSHEVQSFSRVQNLRKGLHLKGFDPTWCLMDSELSEYDMTMQRQPSSLYCPFSPFASLFSLLSILVCFLLPIFLIHYKGYSISLPTISICFSLVDNSWEVGHLPCLFQF